MFFLREKILKLPAIAFLTRVFGESAILFRITNLYKLLCVLLELPGCRSSGKEIRRRVQIFQERNRMRYGGDYEGTGLFRYGHADS